ncbi:MAG: phosphoribosylformylglycinamidine synthase subunit PurS [Candidatus Omnitrophica bacterium]|nr:phosphoribosylformylglycinamidine synthase subunit PurS [Candidatus Omnitrophota bacterium]MCM8809877.1 phosphoribosylformylglycinamidine synthase subunit PurS [Candidatus Omnitrophota bacterium]MCM8810463.1 phosphoribosylformylglycinamidine synthase subunit PurS [Candidatus Omnitrophota bacterium]
MNRNFWIIEIYKKKNIRDVFGQDIKKSIEEIGISGIEEVKVSNLYKIECKTNKKNVEKIAKELLIDKVSEDFSIYKKTRTKKDFWIIEIFLKDGVTDPVGETARNTIIESKILDQVVVKTGKKYYIKGKVNQFQIKEICEKILANTLIQNYFIFKKGFDK